MKFHIANLEPQGFRYGHFLDDQCRLLAYALESLGHDCSIGHNQLEPGRTNIIFGGHTLPSPDNVTTIAEQGPYIVWQSEILQADRLNRMDNHRQYQEVYLPLLQRAVGVWEGVPANFPMLEQLGIRAPLLRTGYHPALEEIVPKRTKDIDFLFYGSTTPHRRNLLQALASRGHRVATTFDARAIFRNDLIARTKVNLAPAQGAGMNHLAYGRICYLLNNRSLVVVEACEDQEWLEHCFPSAETDRWVDLCEEVLLSDDRQQMAEQFCEQYRRMPHTALVEKVLEKTYGHALVEG